MTLRKKPRRASPSRKRRPVILIGPLEGTISAVLEFDDSLPSRNNASLELRDRRVLEKNRSRNGSSGNGRGHHAVSVDRKGNGVK